ncbi:MAG TPA: hypothetical protein VFZ77_11740 [Acidimicrobiales bacterium]
MKAAVATVVLAAGSVLGIDALADLTQNRPDAVVAGTTTVVRFDVGTRRYQGSDLDAARALWATCAATVGGEKSGPTESAGSYEVTISPAIGENGRKRLLGCMEDATLDRVQGHVQAIVAA